MQILYGVDTDTAVTAAGYGSANKFIPANQVTAAEWPNVVAVRVDLALRSLTDDVNPGSSTYTYGNGTSVSDKRIRQQYSTTIALRNRAP
jgi:type IV pilus assembly protein PilW